MIDLSWTESSLGLALCFNILFILYIFLYYWRYVNIENWGKRKINVSLILFSLLLIIIVSENSSSDWYHYQELVWTYDFSENATNYGEPIYGIIIKLVNKNYLLFRLVVWGGAFLLTCLSFKRFGLNINVAVFVLIAAYLTKFNYARVSLAMASYYYGISFLVKPQKNKKILNLLLVTLFFYCSYQFHYSMLPMLIISLAVYTPIDKSFFTIILLIAIPLLASFLFANFDLLGKLTDEEMYSRFNRYLDREGTETTFFGRLADFIRYGAFVVPIVINSLIMFRHRVAISMPIRRVYRVTMATAIFSATFLFMGLSSTVFTYRYLYMTFIPLTIITVFLYENRFMTKKYFSLIVMWGIMSIMYFLLYGLYKVM